ncbi:hypothetical protein TNCV_4999771 [Trichonephila clavipes]|nr:hypothetical protein TNCV_4999771 [Trichonephila clavipes]
MQVTVRFCSRFHPDFEGVVWGLPPIFPSTNLTRELAARGHLQYPHAAKALYTYKCPSPRLEPRPYGTAVSVTNHYTGWVGDSPGLTINDIYSTVLYK